MQLPVNSTTVPTRIPARELSSGLPGYLVDEDTVTRQSGSYLTSKWVNDVSEELINVILDANLVPDGNITTQIRDSIRTIANDSASGVFPSGTKLVFVQPTAPAGWVIDVNHNNRMLRVSITSGGSVGGTDNPILNNKVTNHGHYVVSVGSTSINGNHTHGSNITVVADGLHSHVHNDRYYVEHGTELPAGQTPRGFTGKGSGATDTDNDAYLYLTDTTGVGGYHTHNLVGGIFNGGDHQHNVTVSGNTDGVIGASNWTPRYSDVIVCIKQ